MKSALILLNAPVSDAAAKMFAEPDRLDTEGDAAGAAGALGDTDGEADALGVADADAVTVGVGVAEALGDELVFTLLPLQPVAIIAMHARSARPYRSLTGARIMEPFLSSVGACPSGP